MKEYENDLQYMKEQFAGDGTEVPESLSEEAVFAMLENVPQQASPFPGEAEPRKAGRRRWQKPVAAVAACACLVLGITALHPWDSGDDPVPAPPATGAGTEAAALLAAADTDENGMVVFGSYEELDSLIAAIVPEEEDYLVYEEAAGDAARVESAEAPAAATGSTGANAAGDTGSAPDHSSTYTQVDGIDEADIVKTDGRYIYYVSDYDNRIRIASAKDGKAENIASVRGDKCGTYIYDLYIRGDQLVVLGEAQESSFSALHPFNRRASVVTVFDITDRSNPQQTGQYIQSGTILSSRLSGSTLYLVTNDAIYTYEKNRCFPGICFAEGDWEDLPLGDICCFPETATPTYTVIGTVDLDAASISADTVQTKAILGGSEEVYCSQQALYLSTSFYPSDLTGDTYYLDGEDTLRTRIVKLALTGDAPAFAGSAVVPGWLNDQFSMDDSNGLFKAATTTSRSGRDTNNLFLFDENMQALGSVRDFAKDEHIEAVRYIKDKAYIITYEQTDPLFIIDLADPEEPDIIGHVKISGFSTLLVPASDEYLLGLGFSTQTNEWGEATDGVKLALFDISDAAQPAVSDSKEFEGMESEVQYNHKALLVGPDGDYYAIPYEIWTYNVRTESYDTTDGILVFTAKDGKMEVLKDIRTEDKVRRCVYIGEYLYGICGDDTIEGFAIP